MTDALHILSLGKGGWGGALLLAAGVTFALSILGFLLGAFFGAVAASGGLSPRAVPSWLAKAYGTVFRGVPDLLTIYLLYYGGSIALTEIGKLFGSAGFVGLPTFATGVLAIGIISGAYQAEVYRGAYLAVDPGQFEACKALGVARFHSLRLVIIPQLMRHALPGLGNVWQLVLKDSALISVIGLVELMRQSQIGAGSMREPFVFYLAAAALYFLIAAVTGSVFRYGETRAWRGMVHA
ncbi:ABC transporter permease subunit [Mesorhizobium sp. M4B.F.Ca.ET.215.01.1.1]|uniref:ABC transporter permease n=1 Tax=unclassified Mesorhizobium TaxID=325217 RepID=UPI000FD5C90D|nr:MULTISPECIES: ABC transporter permease subunit [unclassified Mesorhizobium]RUW23452.1 ABC transporter permease subunit [Mesorhizobium sp. M4B.F.Ca.ET.013.02.1.1]TGQ09519.1 ABC transporter permease subunit [Mesorhizobium sp. M4B.F.Ca.ET.215.01.1.1]TGQ37443.1 ABC transporter permease subunit [Mesorhizobium sp. M00.F.Ca.ET.220.01.1.1]TGQ97318.1 ABC transporter permease subunit [Mesorhizobium sp. M4B.F.Ca.ET.203.01.1.1]TIT28447.1 MAG: ABC transporter permease subunit [Mesorhizobium sp.]